MLNRLRAALTTALTLLMGACSAPTASAKQHRATPVNIKSVLEAARAGDVVVLEPGIYSNVRISQRDFSPALVLDARAATVDGFSGKNITGLRILGGHFRVPPPTLKPSTGQQVFGYATRFDSARRIELIDVRFSGPGAPADTKDGPFGEGYGVFVVAGSDVEVLNGRFLGLKNGIVLSRVEGFKIAQNQFSAMRSDGINVAESQKGLIDGNICGATRIRDAEHPDCIQMWSRPTSPPTADIVIRGNRAEGMTQGIGLFNHVRDGVDDGGFDRITVEDNDLTVGFPQGISLNSGRASIVRNNRVRTLPGSKYRASISTGPGVLRCGNVVESGAGKPGLKDPAC